MFCILKMIQNIEKQGGWTNAVEFSYKILIINKPTFVILVNTSIHLRSGDVSTMDCGLHRNDKLTIDKLHYIKIIYLELKSTALGGMDYKKLFRST
jgi:hypothetical protein